MLTIEDYMAALKEANAQIAILSTRCQDLAIIIDRLTRANAAQLTDEDSNLLTTDDDLTLIEGT